VRPVHEQVLSWVGQFRTDEDLAVLDIGGRDLNGSTRFLFPNANPYHVLDVLPGLNVDFVADAADWKPQRSYDLVVCTETFEHAKRWREIVLTAWDALRPGGWFIFTCAGPGRPPHSGVEAVWGLIGDEWYANVSPEEIQAELVDQGWAEIATRQQGLDTQGKAIKPLAEVAEPAEVLMSFPFSRTAGSPGTS
jgi:SAM-dependent methyltransferase